MKKIEYIIIILLIALSLSCGSKPKREMQITTIHSNTNEMLESANASILSGEYDKPHTFWIRLPSLQ